MSGCSGPALLGQLDAECTRDCVDAGPGSPPPAFDRDAAQEGEDGGMASDPASWEALCSELSACDDQDLCTNDICVADGCMHEPSERAAMCGAPCGPRSRCGDGIVDPEEACDDGNLINGDGCNRDCAASGEVHDATALGLGAQLAEEGQVRFDAAGSLFLLSVFSEMVNAERTRTLRLLKLAPDNTLLWQVPFEEEHLWLAYQLDLSMDRPRIRGLLRRDGEVRFVERLLHSDGSLLREAELHTADEFAPSAMVAFDDHMISAGSVSFVGEDGKGRRNILIQSLDAVGQPIWQLEIERALRQSANKLLVLDDGRIAVGGYVERERDGESRTWVGLVSPDGELLWDDIHETKLASHVSHLAYDREGARLVVGASNFDWTSGLYFDVLQYDLSGQRTWFARVNDPDLWEELLESLIVDSDGNVVIGGWIRGGSTTWLTKKWSRDGTELWTRIMEKEASWANTVVERGCGELLVIGGNYTPDTEVRVVTP